jgi:hypothetical protein
MATMRSYPKRGDAYRMARECVHTVFRAMRERFHPEPGEAAGIRDAALDGYRRLAAFDVGALPVNLADRSETENATATTVHLSAVMAAAADVLADDSRTAALGIDPVDLLNGLSEVVSLAYHLNGGSFDDYIRPLAPDVHDANGALWGLLVQVRGTVEDATTARMVTDLLRHLMDNREAKGADDG